MQRNMLLFLLISFLDLAPVHSAAITPPLHLLSEAQLSLPPRNSSTAAFEIQASPNNSLASMLIDPRFTYDRFFADHILDRKSAYMTTLLSLAELSTKGWTPTLKWDEQYSRSSYGDVTIRIRASQNPSTLQYRHAIWGLYSAIRETSANGFRACVLSLYWSSSVGEKPQILGYLSILGVSSLGIGSDDSPEGSPKLPLPTQTSSPILPRSNLTTTLNKSASLATGMNIATNSKIEISLLDKLLDIDAIFHTIYAGVVYLASWPQSKRVDKPGYILDHLSRTALRWDSSYQTSTPYFEYRHVIMALARLPVYMYEQNRFEDARFIVYIDEIEVGRGWLYKKGVGGVPKVG